MQRLKPDSGGARLKRSAILVITCLCALVLSRCQKPDEGPASLYPDLKLSAGDSLEAVILSYYLDQSLTAEDSSLQSNLYHLNHLRQSHRQAFPFLDSLRFLPPWAVGSLSLGFEDLQIQQILSNQYSGWDALPAEFRPDSVVVTSEQLGFVLARVNPRYHPVLLAESYQGLPGLKWAEASRYGVYDYPCFPLLIFSHAGQWEAVFHLSSDQPEESVSHHFKYLEGQPVYVGELPFFDLSHSDSNYVDLAFDFMFLGPS